jgi:hypothetical protein
MPSQRPVFRVTEVAEVHAVVPVAIPSLPVALKSCTPKFRPATVSREPPDSGAFRYTPDRTGALKVKVGVPVTNAPDVPVKEATVTCMYPG